MAANDYPAHLTRYPRRAAIDKLALLLDLPNELGMQDWEIQVADPSRLAEFLQTYERLDFNDVDRFTLMRVIVASLDDAVSVGFDLEFAWQQAAALLRRDAHLHATTLSYWSCGVDPDPEHQFRVTPRIRTLWHEIRPVLRKSHRFARPRTLSRRAIREGDPSRPTNKLRSRAAAI
jgi:hypothetical protein